MKLFVQYADNTEAREVDPATVVEDLAQFLGVAAIYFGGRLLRAEETLASVPEDSTVVAVAPVDGAGKDKKRKKKAKKTPKVQPHVHKKDKLGLLKLYKVTGDKVDSLRDYCPHCGAGVRLAKHKDRVHCGRCGFAGK